MNLITSAKQLSNVLDEKYPGRFRSATNKLKCLNYIDPEGEKTRGKFDGYSKSDQIAIRFYSVYLTRDAAHGKMSVEAVSRQRIKMQTIAEQALTESIYVIDVQNNTSVIQFYILLAALLEKAKPKKLWKNEETCRNILENMFPGEKFPNSRPAWLINPSTGKRLELDCYNKERKIAVEYNGIQHYKQSKYFKVTKEKLEKQKERDATKVKLCKDFGVNLIVIPYTVKNSELEEYIKDNLNKHVEETSNCTIC